jgi:hypothetical protein
VYFDREFDRAGNEESRLALGTVVIIFAPLPRDLLRFLPRFEVSNAQLKIIARVPLQEPSSQFPRNSKPLFHSGDFFVVVNPDDPRSQVVIQDPQTRINQVLGHSVPHVSDYSFLASSATFKPAPKVATMISSRIFSISTLSWPFSAN